MGDRPPIGVLALGLVLACLVLPVLASADETVGVKSGLSPSGRQLDPVGRMTPLGAFPTGGAIAPDGEHYWAVDAGRGDNAVRIINLDSGEIVQTLPIPGGYVGVAFAPDGRRAYVSGQPAEGDLPDDARGLEGDVIHVYEVAGDGTATEIESIELPDARNGAAAFDELPPASNVNAWPEGLAVTPDGTHLVVALGQADQAAIVSLASGKIKLADVGRYPYGVAIDPKRDRAYVSNERDGTVTAISVPGGEALATIEVGGPTRSAYSHPEGMATDPARDRLYVAVTDRDRVAVINTKELKLVRTVAVGRPEAEVGSAPVNLSVDPEGDTLYVANAGEDAVVGLALTDRKSRAEAKDKQFFRKPRSIRSIGRYRLGRNRARRAQRRAVRRADSKKERRQARRKYRHKRHKLKGRRLRGARRKACSGPRGKQDRRYGRRVLNAYERRALARRRARKLRNPKKREQALKRASRRFRRKTERALELLPELERRCDPPGSIPGTPAFEILGRFPTASYTTDVEVSPDGERLVWLAAKGLGTGPNADGQSIKKILYGRAGVLERPTDKELAALTPRADAAVIPTNFEPPPVDTPIVGPGGSPSRQIKHVFYVVRENRTYDQIFGSDPRGQGDPSLQVFDDNGVPGPTGGVTPNAHELSRRFALYDAVFANSEESTAGHKITTGAYANDYTHRYNFTNRGRKGNPDIFPIGIPPNAFIFDQAVRQSVGFRVYGELGAGNQPFGYDGRPTFAGVMANTDLAYPSQLQGTCRPVIPFPDGTPLAVRCTADAGSVGGTSGPPTVQSRVNTFRTEFAAQLATGTVPAFNYLILFNDHTDGSTPGVYTPRANVADNDLALGQIVELVSQSSIWKDSAIFVVEDDSQDGADSVDAHRMPAFVISPWAKQGGQVISTRYDHYSFLRTIELILGLRPLSINDALATPLYDAFISTNQAPDVEGSRYEAIQPETSMTETNPANGPNAALSAALPYDQTDRVPQRVSDRIIWQSVFGADSTPPPPGPNFSPLERARAVGTMRRWRRGGNVRRFLMRGEEGEDERRLAVTAGLLSATRGMSRQEALDWVEGELEDDEEHEEAERDRQGEPFEPAG